MYKKICCMVTEYRFSLQQKKSRVRCIGLPQGEPKLKVGAKKIVSMHVAFVDMSFTGPPSIRT